MTERNFEKRNNRKIKLMDNDKHLKKITKKWFETSYKYEYSYHFQWLGRPIIQYPQDVIAIQEIIWKVKPDIIIETGIAHGGSLILSASILELIGKGKVLGIDIDIRKHNKNAIKKHPLSKRIQMIQGSSISKKVVKKVYQLANNKKRILIILDSNHTHEHVINELEMYSPLVTKNSYLIVMDTIVENMPEKLLKNRPWGKGNNPMSAVKQFLKHNNRFKIDTMSEKKLLISVAPNGFLKCVKNFRRPYPSLE